MSELNLINRLNRFLICLVIICIILITIIEQNTQFSKQDELTQLDGQNRYISNQKMNGNNLIRTKRGLIDFLYELRKKRNPSVVLHYQMKNWLKFESQVSNKTEKEKIIEIYIRNKEAEKRTWTKNKVSYKSKWLEEEILNDYNNTEETTDDIENINLDNVRSSVYKEADFQALCNDPIFSAVDSSLDGSEILIFKGNKFYVMEDLRYGTGKLVASGLSKELLPNFHPNGFDAMLTIKEGGMRGYTFGFYNNNYKIGWTPTGYTRARHINEFKLGPDRSLPKNGFDAVLHNRNILKPLMIGFKGKTVYYYKTENKMFTKVKELNHAISPEKFPSNLTAAFSMPNGYVYLFRKNKHCIREMNYVMTTKGVYCDVWHDNSIFLGCFGQIVPPYIPEAEESEGFRNSVLMRKIASLNPDKDSLCDNIPDVRYEKSLDGLLVLVFSKDKLWSVQNFTQTPNVRETQLAKQKWTGFEANPDATMIVHEGKFLRGTVFEFKNGRYHSWGPDGKLVARNKSVVSFNAIIHNSDISNPMAVAFSDKKVYYYTTDSATLKLNKTVKYSDTVENWPMGITTGLTINTARIYLFRGDNYCIREWSCSDKVNNCCEEWFSTRDLFECSKN